LLLIRPIRIYGLLFSLLLLLVFTIYVGMVYLNFFERVPCSCGGVFKSMSWEAHLFFNLGFTLLALAGINLEQMRPLQIQKTQKQYCRDMPVRSAGSGESRKPETE